MFFRHSKTQSPTVRWDRSAATVEECAAALHRVVCVVAESSQDREEFDRVRQSWLPTIVDQTDLVFTIRERGSMAFRMKDSRIIAKG